MWFVNALNTKLLVPIILLWVKLFVFLHCSAYHFSFDPWNWHIDLAKPLGERELYRVLRKWVGPETEGDS